MDRLGNKMKNILKCGSCLLILSFVMLGVSYGVDDLLRQAMDPVMYADSFIDMGENVNTVGGNFFEGSYTITINKKEIEEIKKFFDLGKVKTDEHGNALCGWFGDGKACPSECDVKPDDRYFEDCRQEWKWDINLEDIPFIDREPSMMVKVARLLLSLTIALSVTMILYNGMKYIIQTGQGKEGKDLVKNIVYIVIGILIGLFSLIIISIIQSVPNTIEKDIKTSAIEDDYQLIKK